MIEGNRRLDKRHTKYSANNIKKKLLRKFNKYLLENVNLVMSANCVMRKTDYNYSNEPFDLTFRKYLMMFPKSILVQKKSKF